MHSIGHLHAIWAIALCVVGCENQSHEPVLDRSEYPAVLDPVISPEVAADTALVGPAVGSYAGVAVAFGAGVGFVIWLDGTDRVLGSRMDASGKVLDANPLILAEGPGQVDTAGIGFGGQNFLLAWKETSSGAGSSGIVRVARISPNGQILDPGGISLTPNMASYSWPRVAFDGTNYLVVWAEESGSTNEIWARRVTTAGVAVEAQPVELATFESISIEASVAFNGQDYLVAWQTYEAGLDSVRFRRFKTDLTPIGAAPTALITASSTLDFISSPTVSSNGSSWLVAWDHLGLQVGMVDGSGVVGPIAPAKSGLAFPDSVAYGASTFVVGCISGFAPNAELAVQRFDATGAAVGSSLSLGPASVQNTVGGIAFSGTEFLAGYDAGDFGKRLVHATRVAPSGTKVANVVLSQAANTESHPDAAFDGSHYLVVWQDSRGDDFDVYGILVDVQGHPESSDAFSIASGPGDQFAASVTWNGSEFVVVWNDDASGDIDVKAARVSSSGSLLDTTAEVVCDVSGSQLAPRIAGGGGGKSYVVWEDHRGGGFLKIYGARLTGAQPEDFGGVVIADDVRDRYLPSVTFGKDSYLVVWSDERNFQSDEDVFAARVGLDGTLLDPTGISLSQEAGIEHSPRAAWDGSSFTVTWRRFADGAVFVRHLSSDGQLGGDAEEIASVGSEQTPVAAAFDGMTTSIAWQAQGDIQGASLDPAGTVKYAITSAADAAVNPALTSGELGHLLAVYSRPDTNTGALRIGLRTITADGVGGSGGSSGAGGAAGSAGVGAVGGGGLRRWWQQWLGRTRLRQRRRRMRLQTRARQDVGLDGWVFVGAGSGVPAPSSHDLARVALGKATRHHGVDAAAARDHDEPHADDDQRSDRARAGSRRLCEGGVCRRVSGSEANSLRKAHGARAADR